MDEAFEELPAEQEQEEPTNQPRGEASEEGGQQRELGEEQESGAKAIHEGTSSTAGPAWHSSNDQDMVAQSIMSDAHAKAVARVRANTMSVGFAESQPVKSSAVSTDADAREYDLSSIRANMRQRAAEHASVFDAHGHTPHSSRH